ncbi:vWA domain-containing protein [Frigoriglobus tundricola]|uniref:VWFA domain-containing protein n=1 Tax=Frigoriglobus tundricola TaxID=2774151 RepID=A0A6M5YSB7_9BACT|nr:vWA domain-containing protein [Frigoriglobus tundricola]QJW96779.1 hypothetical protein FTUN_4338 [Frigoriglobus tundricola]
MPAPKLLAGLPKPALFGLYGAVGGLIGALVFGELVWFVLRPPPPKPPEPPPPPEPRLAVSASGALQIYQGGTNKVFVQLARDAFDGPVTVRVEGLPAGVTAADVTVPNEKFDANGQAEAEVELRAAFSADTRAPSRLEVVASTSPGGKLLNVNAPLTLTTLASPMPQADIVFVLDVTGSMQNQIDGLKNGIGTFARDLTRAKVDARFGCVAFRDLFVPEPNGFPQMQVLKFKDETFTSDATAFRDEIAKQRASGGGDTPETSFEAISEAAGLKDWRKSASRVLVLITDAPPKIYATPSLGQSEKETIESLRANKIDFLHLVVNDKELPIYRRVQQGALGTTSSKGEEDKGKEFNLNRTAGDARTFTSVLLPEMTKAIVAAAEAKRPDTRPELAARPPVVELPKAVVKGVQSSDSYDAGSSGQLVLAVGVWTGSIAALVCLFLLGGQHHYLRGTLPSVGRALAGLVGGLLVGLIGGAAGQGLFLLAPDIPLLAAIFRVMGWTILGSLAGAGLSLFVPNLKLVYGLAGGAVGGAVGALGYIAVASVASALLGRLAGGLVLGLFIGLMVAVVEAAFRRAWLEVRYGPREVVTVNLGAEPVKVGGDARVCTVWARGAPGVALRYFIRNGQVICTDVPARSESAVTDGDTRAAGNVTVVVRTGSGSPAPVPDRRPAPPPAPRAKPAPAPQPRDLEDDGLPLPASDRPAPPTAPAPAARPVPARRATPPAAPDGAAPCRAAASCEPSGARAGGQTERQRPGRVPDLRAQEPRTPRNALLRGVRPHVLMSCGAGGRSVGRERRSEETVGPDAGGCGKIFKGARTDRTDEGG